MRGNNFQNTNLPKISRRIGVDLNPINLKDEDDVFWTLSLIWPDQVERIQRLKDAIEIVEIETAKWNC